MQKSTIKLFWLFLLGVFMLASRQASAQCDANFSFTVNNTTRTAQFTNLSTPAGDSTYYWDFGSSSSNLKNPSKQFPAPGTYLVCLTYTRTTPTFCYDTTCKLVKIDSVPPCDADFTYTINHTTKTVTFNNTSTGPDTNYLWGFGDNTYSGAKNPVKTYGSAGTYTVCLTKNGPICYDTICKTITINQPCNINFTTSINHATKTVTFNNTSTGDSTYRWTFGDADSSFLKNPTHTYANAGTYTVCLKRRGPICYDSICKTVTINNVCNINFTFSVNNATKTVTFNNTSTGTDSSFLWRFGDNTTSGVKHPVKTYANAGTYTVCLKRSGPICYDSICKTVTITNPCNINFTFSVNNATKTVTFNNTSTGSDSNYFWRFGDNTTSGIKNPVKTYGSAGTYTVCLKRSGPVCYDSICKTVTISPDSCNENADFTYSVNHGTKTVTFTNTSTGPIDSNYMWYFGGGGGSSMVKNPVKTFGAPGTYLVCLYKFGNTCWDSTCKFVTIDSIQPCHADFTYSVNPTTKTVTFTNISTPGSDSSYLWNFGNGTYSTQKNPVKTYAGSGSYIVCLTMNGPVCFDSICKTVYVPSDSCNENADFTYSINQATKTVTFTNTSTGPVDSNYMWYFGGGGSSTLKNPVKTFGSAGNYLVCLYKFGNTCWDSTCKIITIDSVLPCQANFSYTVNHATKTVTFTNTSTPPSDSSYQWNFGNGTYSTLKNPVKTYTNGGSYIVCLFMNGPVCFDSICQTVTIWSDTCNEHADFNYSINQATKTVTFNNTSTGPLDSNYLWYFGSGGSSTLKNPVYTYANTGTYMVCLYKFGNSCWDSICKIITIDSLQGPCQAQASFTYTFDSSNGGLHFTNTSTGSNLSYQWTFGGPNGGTSTAKNPSYHYPHNGTYTICLKVTRTNPNCSSTICDTITINQGPNLCRPMTFMNQDSSNKNKFNFFAYVGGGSPNYYFWDFGDGDTSTQQSPEHIYSQPGMYYVCVTSMRFDGCVSKVCDTVYVPTDSTFACHADFSYDLYPDTIDGVNRIALFTNLSTGNNLVYYWIFGDGETSGIESPMHYYDSNGVFQVCLVVYDTAGTCFDSICKPLSIIADTTTGMATLAGSLNDFNVYPVPFNDVLKLRFAARTDKPVSIRIYNTLGILQYDETRPAIIGTNAYEVNTERLVKGVYFIELSNGDGTITKRTIK